YSAQLADQVRLLEIAEGKKGEALQREQQARRKAEQARFEALLNAARALRTSQRPGQRFASLRAIEEALKLPLPDGCSLDDLRTEAIAALCLPDIEVAREWAGYPAGSTALAFDTEFQKYAVGDEQGRVSVRSVNDDHQLLDLAVEGCVADRDGLQFSSDGRFLFCQHKIGNQPHGRCWDLARPAAEIVFE